MMDKIYIVLSGNIFEGFELFGPFTDFDDACEWAEGSRELEWYVATLKHPIDVMDKDGEYWSDTAKEIAKRIVVNG
jgi:hypothetical protein